MHECLGCRYNVFAFVYQFNFKFEYSCKQSPKKARKNITVYFSNFTYKTEHKK